MKKFFFVRLSISLFVFALLILTLPVFVQAADCDLTSCTFTVSTTTDASDAAAGDGDCATADADCSFRAALEETNNAANDGKAVTINFDSGLTGETIYLTDRISLSHSTTTINGLGTSSLTIDASGVTSVNANDQVFTIYGSGTTTAEQIHNVSISDLKMANTSGTSTNLFTMLIIGQANDITLDNVFLDNASNMLVYLGEFVSDITIENSELTRSGYSHGYGDVGNYPQPLAISGGNQSYLDSNTYSDLDLETIGSGHPLYSYYQSIPKRVTVDNVNFHDNASFSIISSMAFDLTVKNSTLSDGNSNNGLMGVVLFNQQGLLVQNNTLNNNYALIGFPNDQAVYKNGSNCDDGCLYPISKDITIDQNTIAGGALLVIGQDMSDVVITDNTINNTLTGSGLNGVILLTGEVADFEISGNDIAQSTTGGIGFIDLNGVFSSSLPMDISDGLVATNTIADFATDGIRVESFASDIDFSGNQFNQAASTYWLTNLSPLYYNGGEYSFNQGFTTGDVVFFIGGTGPTMDAVNADDAAVSSATIAEAKAAGGFSALAGDLSFGGPSGLTTIIIPNDWDMGGAIAIDSLTHCQDFFDAMGGGTCQAFKSDFFDYNAGTDTFTYTGTDGFETLVATPVTIASGFSEPSLTEGASPYFAYHISSGDNTFANDDIDIGNGFYFDGASAKDNQITNTTLTCVNTDIKQSGLGASDQNTITDSVFSTTNILAGLLNAVYNQVKVNAIRGGSPKAGVTVNVTNPNNVATDLGVTNSSGQTVPASLSLVVSSSQPSNQFTFTGSLDRYEDNILTTAITSLGQIVNMSFDSVELAGKGGTSGSSPSKSTSDEIQATGVTTTSEAKKISVGISQFTRNLGLGATGPDVSALQRLLKELNYFTHPSITTYFGPVTKAALQKFQQANGIPAIGVFGPMTRAAMNKLIDNSPIAGENQTPAVPALGAKFTQNLSLGSIGKEVSALQEVLKNLGYFTFPRITTYFGPATKAALQKFQQANGIPAIGVFGPMTRAAMNKLN